ncbi:response regulator receiver domain containing protein [Acanthamoeba castellanii str. Neff]|uniref:Response regulator receiver domain containing protein n=1 Tax=Acanthamoeba castellanii (strain ATCC 30010 / Neff) TaxID=1257118 RepID=L8HBN6_ACACF|nr:response regulator receiver domain containing protein [Acanthamoeba castellanii str. Neff]ELR21826.1 response regulator receiver domain containing protein [Acanthamoeba castellanii str. Neff]
MLTISGAPTPDTSSYTIKIKTPPSASASASSTSKSINSALQFSSTRLYPYSHHTTATLLPPGSTFRIRIPLGCAHLPQSQIKLPRSAAAQSVAAKYLHDARGEQAEAGGGSSALPTEAQRVKNYTQSASWWLPSLEIVSSAFFTGPDSITALATPPSPRPSAPLREVGCGEERRFRVLLADDNFDMREYVTKLLSERYDVTTASNGMEALAMVQQEPIDLVLTDVMMPLMDGFTLLKALRATSETRMIPVILLSARAGEESKVEGLEAGADDYLIKPFTARELLARVGSHLDMVRMRSEAARREQELRFQEDMLGRDVWDFMADTEDKVVRNNLERAIREQIDVCFEFYYPAKDRWYEHRMYPAVEGGASIFTLDITARKKSEERLSVLAKIGQLLSSSIDCHLPSLLASILKIAAGSVVADWCVLDIVEERGTIERIATPTALANKWKMTKLPWEQRVDPKKYHMVVELCNGDRVGVESDLSSEGDSFIAFPLAARGKVFGTWLFARHHPRGESRAYLEEDKAACEELARRAALAIDNIRLYQDAENANQAKDHFLAALSHELRTPLTPALLLSEALLTEDLPPAITENIKTIHESVELEVQLIDDLLDLTKIARGKLQLHSQELSAHELLGRTLQIVAHDIANKQLNVGVDPRASGDRIVADPARLQQVFWNIIKNAIKFTPENGSIIIRTSNYEIEEEVEEENQQQQQQQASANADADGTGTPATKSLDDSASAVDLKRKMKSSGNGGGGGKGSHIIAPPRRKVTRKKVMLRVEVQDTGIGIEANIIPHLFHAFEQGDSSITIRFGGLGLGLAISRSLVEMHSGALSADSEGKGKGATFTIVLPTIHTSTPSPQLAAAAAAALPPGVTLGATGGARRSGGGRAPPLRQWTSASSWP